MTLICNNVGVKVGKACEDCRIKCWAYQEWKKGNINTPGFRGVITQLPHDKDPNILIEKAMKEKYGVCPFCGNGGNHVWGQGYEKRYGRQHKYRFWEEKHQWRIDHWHCGKCGASWDSEEYPTDIRILSQ